MDQLRRRIAQLRDKEAHLAQLLITGRISDDTYEILRLKWQDMLRNAAFAIRELEQDMSRHLDDLEVGIVLLSLVSYPLQPIGTALRSM